MEKIKTFSLNHPFLFGLVLMIVYALLTALFYPVHFLFPDTETGMVMGDSISKLLVFVMFVLLLWRFGWIQASGVANFGNLRIWLVLGGLLVYFLITHLYAFTGSAALPITDRPLAAAQLLHSLSTSLVEETMVRGLVLVAMILAWGNTRQGQIKAVLVSASLFGLIHLLNLISQPPMSVIFQAVVLFLPGIFYATLVLASRTLWSAILFHGLGNAVVNIKIIGIDNYQEQPLMWVYYAISLIPLLAYSYYLLRKLPAPTEEAVAYIY